MMELKEKALELAEHLNNANIISFNDFEMLADQDYSNIVLQIKLQLQEKYPKTTLKRMMKSVHYANGFPDETLKQCAFILDDIEQYLSRNKLMNHDKSVQYFNQIITAKGFVINPVSLVSTMIDSLLICV